MIPPPCHAPRAATCTLPPPRVQTPENRQGSAPAPGHPHAGAEQSPCSEELQGQNNRRCPTSGGDSQAGLPQMARLGAQFAGRGCNHTSTHTHTHTHSLSLTRGFTDPPLPYGLAPHSHTKCILPAASIPAITDSCSLRVSAEMRGPSRDA